MGAAGGGSPDFLSRQDCRIFRINKMRRGRIRCTNVAFKKKQTSTSELASVSFFDRQSRQAVICLPRWGDCRGGGE